MSSYRAYIFDLDGTITNTMVVWLDLFRQALAHFKVPSPEDSMIMKYTHDWREMVNLGLPEEKVLEFSSYMTEKAHTHLPEAAFHVGAYETLDSLKNNREKIAIFSNMDRPLFESAIKHRNLHTITSVTIAGTDVPHRKPKPDGILRALELLKIPKKEHTNVVYIGDKETDIQSARAAGVTSILYYPASHQNMYKLEELKLHKPDRIITDWSQLLT
ncbi:MAG: HAD-IA family hydrolase [Candidatus Levybacteria bacterium]|nr:HAD-IA family hydrolase [Candidatus Levybacteria bacterium]MBP9815035.1 HAD-IA family hydrolase [Candidatus Levybacteria bacterium]